MKYPYCLPVIEPSKEKILAIIDDKSSTYPYFEVWLDYVQNCDVEFTAKLAKRLANRLVVVFRRQYLETKRETESMSKEQRLRTLDVLQGTSVMVDLDVITQQAELDYVRQKEQNIPTIVSYHNYDETPSDKKLKNILQQIRKNNSRIIKIATMCQNEQDAVRLLNVMTSMKSSEQKFIVLGMGEFGLITRIFGTLWGNELVFAPETANESSAPGQLTRQKMDEILKMLENK